MFLITVTNYQKKNDEHDSTKGFGARMYFCHLSFVICHLSFHVRVSFLLWIIRVSVLHAYIYIYIYIYIHIHAYTHKHTHSHTQILNVLNVLVLWLRLRVGE